MPVKRRKNKSNKRSGDGKNDGWDADGGGGSVISFHHPRGSPGGWHRASNYIDRCPHLTLQEKGLYHYLTGMKPGYTLSADRISRDMHECVKTIQKILRSLERLGLIRRQKLQSGRMTYVFPPYEEGALNPDLIALKKRREWRWMGAKESAENG